MVSFTNKDYERANKFTVVKPTKIVIKGEYAVEGFKGEYGDLIILPLLKKVKIIDIK